MEEGGRERGNKWGFGKKKYETITNDLYPNVDKKVISRVPRRDKRKKNKIDKDTKSTSRHLSQSCLILSSPSIAQCLGLTLNGHHFLGTRIVELWVR